MVAFKKAGVLFFRVFPDFVFSCVVAVGSLSVRALLLLSVSFLFLHSSWGNYPGASGQYLCP